MFEKKHDCDISAKSLKNVHLTCENSTKANKKKLYYYYIIYQLLTD